MQRLLLIRGRGFTYVFGLGPLLCQHVLHFLRDAMAGWMVRTIIGHRTNPTILAQPRMVQLCSSSIRFDCDAEPGAGDLVPVLWQQPG